MQVDFANADVKEVARAKCLESLLFFTRYFFYQQWKKKFIVNWHHKVICEALERVLRGECTRLCISVPPRYGKTELAVKSFIAHGLALNPEARFIHLSYGDDIALDNSEYIKDLIGSAEFQDLFPGIETSYDSKSKKKWYTNQGGGILARSAAGQVTGFGAGATDEEEDLELMGTEEDLIGLSNLELKFKFNGAIIIDDPIKPEDADSDTDRTKVNQRFDSTIRNRANSRNTPIIVIMQRLHPLDLIGYLSRKEEADDWEFISIPALSEDPNGEADENGKTWKALWPLKHTVEELLKLQKANELVFGRQYMLDPSPKSGLLFPLSELKLFKADEVNLDDPDYILACADPADEGGDDFAGGIFKLVGNKIYVTSILYNTDGADLNEPAYQKMILKHNPAMAMVEGVFGWKETANRIRAAIDKEGFKNEFRVVKPRSNKHTRILNRSSFVKNHFYFREDWEQYPQYAKYMRNIISYLRIQEPGKSNKHDDGPDLNEMAAAYFEKTMPHLW